MTTLEESIAYAMDCSSDTALVPFMPYILQDFWELGSSPEIIINVIQKHCKDCSKLRILDLGCGKGAVSVKLAAALQCSCYGIDGISKFIEISKEKAREYGVDMLCRFKTGDIRVEIETLETFDVIILSAIGQVFGDYTSALSVLSKHLERDGIIIIHDAYIDDSSPFNHPLYLRRGEFVNQITQAGMQLIDEDFGGAIESDRDMEFLERRCKELMAAYPEKSALFEKYLQTQAEEYDVLDNQITGVTMVCKKV